MTTTPNAGFIQPEILWLLVAMVPLIVVWSFLQRGREGRLAKWMIRDNWELLSRTVSTRARYHKGVLIFLALALSIVAAARPYWGVRERELGARGINIIMAVDVSISMLANDVTPNRMEHARSLLRQMLAELRGNRVGLMPFAGEAFLQVPITSDYGMLMDLINSLDTNTIGLQGTDIPSVIDQCIDAFEAVGPGERVLILLTDGEDHSNAITQAARKAADNDITIFALGIGTTEGAPVILPNGRFLEDRQGIKVLSRMEPEIVRDLAGATGGRAYTGGPNGMVDPGPLLQDLRNFQETDFGTRTRVVREERYQIPLALAMLCLFVEGFLSDRRRRLLVDTNNQGGSAKG